MKIKNIYVDVYDSGFSPEHIRIIEIYQDKLNELIDQVNLLSQSRKEKKK